MALHVPKAPGFAQMLKEGAKHFSGLEEAVYRNIQACKELAQTTRTAYGPNGTASCCKNDCNGLSHARARGWRWHELCSGICWSPSGTS
uniref:Chaperonin containing TCP1 subunit 8 n=1 Tax=Ursus americanus TaxID=9643 RepID=A0A452QGW2_URSAM